VLRGSSAVAVDRRAAPGRVGAALTGHPGRDPAPSGTGFEIPIRCGRSVSGERRDCAGKLSEMLRLPPLRSRRIRYAALALLLPALLLRALIPAGFMPASGADSVLALQMCSTGTAEAAQTVRIDRDSLLRAFDPSGHEPAGHDDRSKPCDFAVSSLGAAPPPTLTGAVLATLGREPRPQPVRDLVPDSRLPDHLPQPRAPPSHS